VVSILAGAATLAFVYRRHFEAARYGAALAVAAIVAGWGLAQWPTILPGLSVSHAAAPHDTLVAVVVAVLAGGVLLFPSLALLFTLTLTGRLHGAGATTEQVAGSGSPAAKPALLARVAIGCLIVGVGLLNVADARWAHAVGVVSLFGFMLTAFLAIVPAALTRNGDA
jgi:cytochrome d ubiquinol oxidase subunit II